jgi:hypothetical protein
MPHASNDLGRLKADDANAINATICPSVLYGWTRAADRHCATFVFVARVEFHVDFVLETITPNRLKVRQKM